MSDYVGATCIDINSKYEWFLAQVIIIYNDGSVTLSYFKKFKKNFKRW